MYKRKLIINTFESNHRKNTIIYFLYKESEVVFNIPSTLFI